MAVRDRVDAVPGLDCDEFPEVDDEVVVELDVTAEDEEDEDEDEDDEDKDEEEDAIVEEPGPELD